VTDTVADAARAAVRLMAREHVETLAQRLAARVSATAVLDAVALPTYGTRAECGGCGGYRPDGYGSCLRASAEGHALGRADQHVEVMWSGPTSPGRANPGDPPGSSRIW
jgi:hypothetical protein